VNGTEVEAVSEDDLRDAFKELYLQSKPEAKGFAVNQARRRALKEMEKEITHGTVDGVVFWWRVGNPGGF